MKHLFSNAPKVERSGKVVGVFLADKQATDVGLSGDRRWPGRLSPNPSSTTLTGVGQGVGRVDAQATDADVSVCQSVHEGDFDA
jgi:hypothetical protein